MAHYSRLLSDLAETVSAHRPVEVGLGQWTLTAFAKALLGIPENGPLSRNHLLDAHMSLFQDSTISSETREAAQAWWRSMGGQSSFAIDSVLDEALEQMGDVRPDDVDARFIPLYGLRMNLPRVD